MTPGDLEALPKFNAALAELVAVLERHQMYAVVALWEGRNLVVRAIADKEQKAIQFAASVVLDALLENQKEITKLAYSHLN